MKKRTSLVILLLFLIVFVYYDSNAQCAMCKAVVESNQKDGGGIGAGLNTGILYLMSVPYVFLLLGAGFWYYNKKYKVEKNRI